jgi:hypothetical protein
MKSFFRERFRRVSLLAASTLLVLSGGSVARADVVFAWNELMLQIATATPAARTPHIEARVFAIAHSAIDEAINVAVRNRHGTDDVIALQRSAAICAAHDTLATLLPSEVKRFDALRERHLAAIGEGSAKNRGIAIGRTVAARIVQERESDGWTAIAWFSATTRETRESSERAIAALGNGDTPATSPWLSARPFAIKNAKQYVVVEPRTVNRDGSIIEDRALLHSNLFDRVDRSAAVDALGDWFSQRPIVIWNRIARQIAAGQTLDLAGQARLLAVLNVSLADATLSSMHWRHVVGHWRAINADFWQSVNGVAPLATDIVAHVTDTNGMEIVRRESQRVLIPPTPNYPALVATLAGAAQEALINYFRTDDIAFELPIAQPVANSPTVAANARRMFRNVSAAARECAFLASLDERHSKEACIAGYWLGQSVGGYAAKRAVPLRR